MKTKLGWWAMLVGSIMLLAGGVARAATTAADFVVAIDGSSSIYYAASNGDGTFSGYQKLDQLGGVYSDGVVIADFDNDGDLDIIAGQGGSTALYYLFLNNGSNVFTKTAAVGTLTSANAHAMDMAAGDFNNDGNQDFIANGNYWNTAIFLGDGKGGFSKTEMNLGEYGRGLDVVDFDNDGNLDFARAVYYSGYTYVYPGKGDGTFGLPIAVGDTGDDPYGLVAGDFNNDGKADLIINSGVGGAPYFFAGNGDFTFAAPVYQASLDFNNHGGYDGYDYNGDGQLDVVASSYTSYKIRYYPGNGDGTFGTAVEIGATADWCMGIAAPPLKPAVGAPVASITPASATIAVGDAVDFDGTASSSPAGNTISYAWTFGDGGTDTIANPAAHTYAAEGTFMARLLVKDNGNPAQTGASLAKVIVNGGVPTVDTSPVAFGEAQAAEGVWAMTIDGGNYAADAEGLISYAWQLGDDLTASFESGSDSGWSKSAGAWLLNTNVATAGSGPLPISGSGSYQQTNEALTRTWNLYDKTFSNDFSIEADVNLVAGVGEEAHLVFRAKNEGNSYQMIIRGRGFNDVLLYKRINNGDTNLGTFKLPPEIFTGATYPVDLGHTYHLKVVCTGSLIQLYLDGHFLFAVYDSTFSSGRVGFSTYQTNALFDNLTVTSTATGPVVPQRFTSGTHNITLTVADAAGQIASGTIPLTMQNGAAPVANAGGPYAADETQASAGGWSIPLTSAGSLDDVEISKYVWDFGIDAFTGTALQMGKWLTNNEQGVTQSDAVTVVGEYNWSTRYLVTKAVYPKVKGQLFETTLNGTGNGHSMLGFKNTTANFHYNQFPYCFYLYYSNIYIYEDGANRGDTGFTISPGVKYDFQIELIDTGAVYRYRPTGTSFWNEVYRSNYLTGNTELRKGITVYSDTFTLDNFRETTAGATPTVTLFNGAGDTTATLTVYDRANQTATATATITTSGSNPPLANAGADQSLSETAATSGQWTGAFDASGSSDDKGIFLYEWDWAYNVGAGFVPSGDTGLTANHSWSTPGTYTVALRVTDNALQSSIDTLVVTVTQGAPPTAEAGADQTLPETAAVLGQWTGTFDAAGSSDDQSITLFYEWDWNYNVDAGFAPSGDTGQTANHSWSTPGIYTVALRVTDNALQSAIDTLTVTVSQGNPPTANAGGPYAVDEITGNALAGGFTVTLNGGGSTDAESSVLQYMWDLGTNTFTGASIDDAQWYHSVNGVTQNDYATITSDTWSWGTRYLFSKNIYNRAAGGVSFEAKVRSSGGSAMVGFKNTNITNFSYGQMPYAIYFSSGYLYIYEDGSNGAYVGSYPSNTWHDVRIELKPTSGARYYYRVSGAADWILLYDSSYGSATEFRRGADVYSGTFDIDDVKDIAAGVSPNCVLYGLGDHPVTLTVTDQAGQQASAASTVTVSANAAPTAVAGADQSMEGDLNCGYFCAYQFSFDGSLSLDDHGINTYEWDFDYNGTFKPSASGVSLNHTYKKAGVHTVALRVTDHALQSNIATTTVTINAGAPPVADAGSAKTTEGLWPVSFNGGGSTGEVGILRYEWDFGDGTTGVGKTPTHTYWAAGAYNATLIVYDKAMQASTPATVLVTVQATADAPLANAGGPYTAAAGGAPAYFNGSASSDDYGIVKYLWDVDDQVDTDADGNLTNDVDVIGRKPFFTYATAGTYTATLTVVDGAGQTATAQAVVNVAANLAPDVICVPWRPGDPTIPHETYNGHAVTLKAIVRAAGALTYQWNFGDGSPSEPAEPASVANNYAIEATHIYPDSPDGTPFTATLTVWDSTGLAGEDKYYIIVKSDSLDTRANIAIDLGLWYTHKTQDKGNGHWVSYSYYDASASASATQAFEINGHLQTGDNQENPYVETVGRGLAYIFTSLTPVAIDEPSYMTHGNPDTNGNGIALSVTNNRPIYEGGMVMDAIASSGTPLGFAITGGANVKGRFFHEIVTDMVDMYAYAQVDSGLDEGGWQYNWHTGADNSACQWAAIGMLAAEDSFGINVPQFVKEENNKWLNYSYGGVGFGYSGPGNGDALTPSGMVQLGFSDKFTNDPRWQTAEAYIANNWFWQDNNYYAVYALVKALKLARPYPVETLAATGLDWYNDPSVGVRKHLVDQQYAEGHWASSGYGGSGLDTSWAIIMLTPTLFVQAPVADTGNDIIWAYGTELKFDASGSFHTDSTHHIVMYEWDFNGDGIYDFTSPEPAAAGAVYTFTDPNPTTEGDLPQVFIARLRVTDDNEPPQTDIDTRKITVAEPPHVPFAKPGGPYQATIGIPFTLDGSASFDIDPGDSVITYQWDLDNDGVWFDNFDVDTSQPKTTYTYNAVGVYSIGLQVLDKGAFNPVGCSPGLDCIPSTSEPQFTTVTVVSNLPPQADAGGPYTFDEGSTLILDGSGSLDPNNNPLTYGWDLNHDGNLNFTDATGVSPSYQFVDSGDFTIFLQVSDSLKDNVASTAVQVDNVAPTVNVGADKTSNEGDAVSFTGAFNDPGINDTHTQSWNFGDGSAEVTDTLPTHVYTDNGLYTVTLTVIDNDGGVGTDTLTVTVANAAPVANAGPDQTANEGAIVNFSGSWTDAGTTDTHTLIWNFGDGSAVVTDTLPTHVYTNNGVYTVTLTVTDNDGGIDTDTMIVSVLATATTTTSTTTTTNPGPTTTTTNPGPTTTTTNLDPTTTTTNPDTSTTTTTLDTSTTTTTSGSSTTTTNPMTSIILMVSPKWNLLSTCIGFKAVDVFGNGAKFASVWKWTEGVTGGKKWAIYLPGGDSGASYAKAKGFDTLTSISSGEGFWLNSKLGQQVTISGSPVYGELSFTAGWNLVGVKGKEPLNVADLGPVTSVWKWIVTKKTWEVSLPTKDDKGAAYAASKGFDQISTINPGEGVWVNK